MRLLLSILIVLSFLFPFTMLAQTNDKVAEEVIAITKAQWKAQTDKKPASVWMKTVADEYTKFNSDSPTRLDGKELIGRLYDASVSDNVEFVADEMVNEKVQVYGDVAILSYNYVGYIKDKDGKVEPKMSKSTRVYAKKNGKWMLVHANFAPVK